MSEDWWRQWQGFAASLAPPQATGAAPGGFGGFAEAAERFRAAAHRYQDLLATAPQESAQAAQAFGEFLREQFAEPQGLWNSLIGAAGAPPPAEWPALGASREYQQRWQRMASAAQRVSDAQRGLQRMWTDAVREAAQAFMCQLPQRSTPADAHNPEQVRALYDTWIDCAEASYARLAHSAAFCDAQAEAVNASSAWRREAQAAIEQWAKTLDLPTRSEFNSLALRLKTAEEQLQQMRTLAAGAQATP